MESTDARHSWQHRRSQDTSTGLQRTDSRHSQRRLSDPGIETTADLQDASFNPGNPRAWRSSAVVAFSGKVFAPLFGLNPFKTTYLSLYDSLHGVRDVATACAGAFFAVVAGIPLPIIGYIFGKIINDFPPSESQLQERIGQLLGVAVAYFVVTAIYLVSFGLTSERISVRLRERLLDCLLHLDLAYMDTHDVEVNSLLTEKIDTIKAGCSEKVGIFIQSISYFVAAFTVGFILDSRLTGILLASVVPAITLTFVFLSPAIARSSRAASEHSARANEVVESALGAVKVVQAFDIINELCKRHMTFLEAATNAHVRKAIFAALQTGSVYFIAYAANGLAFYLGSREADGGNAGTVYAVVFLILDASFVVGQFAPFLEIFARASSARSAIQDLFDAREDARNRGSYRVSAHKPKLRGKDVRFEDVIFSYPARPTVKALNGVDLTLRSGEFTALVGTSGGGKSTMVSLLLGMYDYSGVIRFGEENTHGIDAAYLRSQIAVLDQDSVVFTGTIFDNICHGLTGMDLSDDERAARCQRAVTDAAVDFLDDLPQGIHTLIGNEVQLSGGQRQRICLARAIVKDPALLILDEPTSALDAQREMSVMQSLKRIKSTGTTVVMVAHRLSTVLDADHLAVMSDGKVVEQGSPQDLSREGTVFRSLLDAQNTNFDLKQDNSAIVQQLVVESGRQAHNRAALDDRIEADVDEVEDVDDGHDVVAMTHSRTLLQQVARSIRPDGWIALLGLLGSVLSGGILLGEALVFGNLVQLLNTANESSQFNGRADFFCLMFFILACIALVAYICSGSAFGVTSARFTARMQMRILRRLLHLDIQWFHGAGHSVHDLMGAFTKDPGDLSCLSGVALGTIFTILTSVVGGIILAHVVAWKIAIVLLSAVPIMVIAGYTRLRILAVSEARHREAYSKATSHAAESCRSRRAVTAMNLERHMLSEYKEALLKPYKQSRRFTVYSNSLLAFCFAITYFVYALAYWWGAKQVRNHTYSTKQFFTVLPALLFSAQAAGQLFSLSPEIARAKTAAQSIFSLLNARSKIMNADDIEDIDYDSVKTSTSSEKTSPERDIKVFAKVRFHQVSLSYPGNKGRSSLNNVSFAVESGQTVALVGPSGAGKSSTVALIERFFDTTSGTLFIDGVDVRNMDVRVLRASIGLVSQEPDLFTGSVTYNVKLGARPGTIVSDEDVENVCKRCGLHDFISSLPEGYNTECGAASSSKLSGGQRQRLAIARALIRDPEILLLDEPTSALDAHSESYVQASLTEAAKDRTTIIVAHRLASIQHVDRIFVFDQGQVVAEGTHAELVANGGLYASMAKAQSLA